jgi:hypothetical protein
MSRKKERFAYIADLKNGNRKSRQRSLTVEWQIVYRDESEAVVEAPDSETAEIVAMALRIKNGATKPRQYRVLSCIPQIDRNPCLFQEGKGWANIYMTGTKAVQVGGVYHSEIAAHHVSKDHCIGAVPINWMRLVVK